MVKRPKQKSRPERMREAASAACAAIQELMDIRSEYQDWRDNLPEQFEDSALAEKLDAVLEPDLEEALDMISGFQDMDYPLGFGRD